MKSQITERAGCRKKIHVEIERERLDREIETTLKKLKKEVQIPGFRKGKAPDDMIMRRVGGGIREEALKEMIPKVLQELFETEDIHPVGEPELSDLTLEEGAPITFNVSVEEIPEVDIELFKGLEAPKRILEVSEEDLDAALENLRRAAAVQEEVDREVRSGDIIVANLQELDSTGVPIIGKRMEEKIISIDEQSEDTPDFDRQVVGMRKGESKKVFLTYDESAETEEHTQGFNVEILRVYENRKPELNDEFAQSQGNYSDLDELRRVIRADMEHRAETISEKKLRDALINEYIHRQPFEVPEIMVKEIVGSEIERIKKDYPDEQIDEEAFRTRIRPDAVRAAQTFILEGAIKEKLGIEASREEVNERLEKEALKHDVNPKELRRAYIKRGRLDSLKRSIEQDKVFEWIKSVAVINEEKVSREAPPSRIITP